MEKFEDYLKEVLKDDTEAQAYINAALEQFFIDHDKGLFLASLKQVITAKGGMASIAQKAHINRQHLYRILSNKGNPSFDNVGSLLTALDLKLKVEVIKVA
jgi:probable addiction module antidote protein